MFFTTPPRKAVLRDCTGVPKNLLFDVIRMEKLKSINANLPAPLIKWLETECRNHSYSNRTHFMRELIIAAANDFKQDNKLGLRKTVPNEK